MDHDSTDLAGSDPLGDPLGDATGRAGAGSGWKDAAACRGGPLAQFFEHRMVSGRPHPAAFQVAQRFCAECPVLASCRAEAERNDAVGLWGGQWRPLTGGRVSDPVDLLPGRPGAP